MSRSLAGAAYGPGERVVFVSDVHLYHGGQEYLEQFLSFLEQVRVDGAAAVYVHGDLFDFYVGPRQGARPFYRPLFQALVALRGAGIPVGIIHGNRDFLMGKRFLEAGCELLPDEIVIHLGSLSVHLSHGDQFCIHDRSYQFWARGVLRASPIRFMVRQLPVAVATWLATRYRRVSSRKIARAEEEQSNRLESVLDGVRNLIDREPVDAVVCGHIHHLAQTSVTSGDRSTTLYTTGAWEQAPNFIEWQDGTLRVRTYDASNRAGQISPSSDDEHGSSPDSACLRA